MINMNVMSLPPVALFIVIAVPVIIGILIIRLLADLGFFIKTKGLYYQAESLKQAAEIAQLSEPSKMLVRLRVSDWIITLIEGIVSQEIDKLISTRAMLNKAYDYVNVDEDVKGIIKVVNEALREGVLTDKDIVFTPEYVVQYTSSFATLQLLERAKEHNATVFINNTTV